MPLINFRGLGKNYRVRSKCNNCGEIQELSIPKGETVENYMKDERAICSLCGCNELQLKRGDKNALKPS